MIIGSFSSLNLSVDRAHIFLVRVDQVWGFGIGSFCQGSKGFVVTVFPPKVPLAKVVFHQGFLLDGDPLWSDPLWSQVLWSQQPCPLVLCPLLLWRRSQGSARTAARLRNPDHHSFWHWLFLSTIFFFFCFLAFFGFFWLFFLFLTLFSFVTKCIF